MKRMNSALFNQLRERSTALTLGWRLERTDGLILGFTSGDKQFTYDGVVYKPSNAFSPMAIASKSNMSVDNSSVTALISDDITNEDLLAGKWDNALIKLFWVNPENIRGIIPLRSGKLGEVRTTNGQFEAELRSVFQGLQQPFGDFYTLECSATLGDAKCKVWLEADTWVAAETYLAKAGADAGIGSYVKPTVENGYWYQCVGGDGDTSTITTNPTGTAVLEDPDISPTLTDLTSVDNQTRFHTYLRDQQEITADPSSVTAASSAHVRRIATTTDSDLAAVTIEGVDHTGGSFYNVEVNEFGTPVDSHAYLTPTKEGRRPLSAPDGVQPITITNGSTTITYVFGVSGDTEPDWPTTVGDLVTDGTVTWRCIRARRMGGAVDAVSTRNRFTDIGRAEPDDWWKYGNLTWLTGLNAGFKVEVMSYKQTSGEFMLLENMPFPLSVGDTFEVVQGCPKTRLACMGFDNIHNFRGFPDMPTEEKALATANIVAKGGKKKQDSGGS